MSLFSGNVLVDLLGIIVAVFAVLYAYIQWSYQIWKRKGVPYFPPKFPFGNRQPLDKTAMGDDVFNLSRKAKENGWSYYGLFLGMKPFFVPLDIELIKSILIKDFNVFTERGLFYNEKDDPLSANLFAVGGNKWKKLRTKVTPTFTSGKLKAMFQTLVDCSSELEKFLKEEYNKEPLDIKNVLMCFTIDVIGSCAFGIECNNFKDANSPFLEKGMKVFNKGLYDRFLEFFAVSFPTIAKALHIKTTPSDVSKFFYDVVTKTVDYRDKNNLTRKDFLQLLIDLKKSEENSKTKNSGDDQSFSMDDMVAQSFVFFLAGFETSSTTVTFALLELSRNQDIQDKVREELLSVLKKYDNKVCYDALKDLEYMTQVIDEALRMYPPGAFITRQSVQDYKVPNSNLVLEKGTNVIIPVQTIHYDETFYDEPEKFDPDRFSPEQKQNRHPLAHLPFGEGPRICIGMRFGMMESKIALATILKDFRVKLNHKTKTPVEIDPMSFVTTIKGGVWLDLEKIS